MAQAISKFIAAYGKGGQNQNRVYYEAYFWGDDVPEGIDGMPNQLEIFLSPSWTLSDLKTAVLNAIKAKATELGLTLADANIFLDTQETGQMA